MQAFIMISPIIVNRIPIPKNIINGSINILINLHDGSCDATAWGCDLTYDYVKINGDYRT